jgi:ubiquinol-cytochrome c reductase cytochrome c subunit
MQPWAKWIWAVSAVLAAQLCSAQSAQGPAGSAERGRKSYMEQLCYTCHGTVGQGGERGAGPRIAPNPWPWPAFAQQTRKPRAVMPPYTEKNLSDQDLADIYAYIRSVPAQRAAKDIPELNTFQK